MRILFYLALTGISRRDQAAESTGRTFSPWSYQKTDATYGVLRAEYEFNPYTMAYAAAAGFGESKARLVASFAFPLHQSGDFTETY